MIEDEQPVNWTISDIDRRPVGPEGELKRCLSFVEHEKPMTLNITNIRVLRDLFEPTGSCGTRRNSPECPKGSVIMANGSGFNISTQQYFYERRARVASDRTTFNAVA